MRTRLLLSALLLATRALAATYYVAPAGSDAADGLTPGTAFATLQHAADLVNPGDVVRVANGNYAGFYLDRDGTVANPITFLADGGAVQITQDNGTTPDGINLEDADHVVLDGFIVNGRSRAGIRVVLADGVTVRNCRLGNNQRWGILTGFTNDFVAEGNEAYGSVIEHGIYISNSCDRPIVRDNHVHDNRGNGIHLNGDASQGGDGLITDAVIERNTIHGNGLGGGSGINGDGLVGAVIRNNLLYDNHASGISLYRIDAAAGATNNLVVNNTIVNASDGRWCVNITGGSTGNVVRNNILYNFHAFRGVITVDAASRPGFVSDYNSLMHRLSLDDGNTILNLAGWQAAGYDAHSFVATPTDHFVAPGSDFHLLASSPALDAGTPLTAPPDDRDGGARPVGAGFDLGAYESQLLTCGDGNVDAGEQCGEPGLVCGNACTACVQCVCTTPTPVCGDGMVCGSEACEIDADCSGGQVCNGCQCGNAAVCASGVLLAPARLVLAASPAKLIVKAEAVLTAPLAGVDPIAHGVRVIVDATSGTGGVDVTVPAGAFDGTTGWRGNGAGTKWTFTDRSGSQRFGRVVVRDLAARTPGRVALAARGKGAPIVLPPATAVRTQVVFGTAAACATRVWGPPGGVRPRCDGDGSKLSCR
jgi:Right handed beta helix region